jgi:sarcosine oxidase, subunit delta
MLEINCPFCGPRAESEFSCGGQAHITRPPKPDQISDAEWGEYLYHRTNIKGSHLEQWVHTYGCRRWFNVERDTVSYSITRVYQVGEPKPQGHDHAV